METPEALDERVPCPDGACTGILDATGACGTCGRLGEVPARAGEAAPAAAPAVAPAAALAGEPATDDRGAGEPPRDDAPTDAAEGEERVPCDDGMCTGVVGRDRRCGTCGRAAAGA